MNLTDQLQTILDHLSVLKVEGVLTMGALFLLLLTVRRPSIFVIKTVLSFFILAAFLVAEANSGFYFLDWIRIDPFVGKMGNLLILSTLIIVWFIKRPYQNIEFYFFLVSGLTGAMIMLKANHFLLIYLGIELTSFSSYFLTGARLKPKSTEAMLKYLLFGGVVSSVMIYGMSLIYGTSGTLSLSISTDHAFTQLGLFLFFAGLLFKTSLLPFHLWVPSTYQEAPSDAVAFFSIVPKISGFVLMYHILTVLPMDTYSIAVKLLMAVALGTVLWGTLTALPQIRLKRTIAYGAIAHSGFLLPLILLGDVGLKPFTYYACVYAIMNIGVFYLIQFHEHEESKSTKFKTLEGFGKEAPLFASTMVVFLIALTGLPPTAGFSAKLLLFSSVYQQYLVSQDMVWWWYLIIGVLTSVLSLFYYMKLPVSYFLKENTKSFDKPSPLQLMAATIFAGLLLWIFIQPEILDSFVL